MNITQELTLATASLLQLEPTSEEWAKAYARVWNIRQAIVEASTKPKQEPAKVQPQPKPAPSDDEQKQMVVEVLKEAPIVNKVVQEKAKAKPAVAKVGGIKSKEKRIIDMSAAELKALAKKHSIDYSTVNFRKADEKDAFRSKLAKMLGRSSELNYSVK